MSESNLHRELVDHIRLWVAREWFNGDDSEICVDDGNFRSGDRPPAINGHVPDVFAIIPGSRGVVVGEAKTPGDLETDRSEGQLTAFIRYCRRIQGSFLVIAVPWTHEVTARVLVRRLKENLGCTDVRSIVVRQLDVINP